MRLPHSFFGNHYLYEALTTENIMDYSHWDKDTVTKKEHTAIKRISSWYWQWQIINNQI